MHNVAVIQFRLGHIDEALAIEAEVLRIRTDKLGREHPQTLSSLNNLGMTHLKAGHLDQAASLFQEVVTSRRKSLGAENPDTLAVVASLGCVQERRGEYATAEPLLLEADRGFVKRQEGGGTLSDDKHVLVLMMALVELYEKSNQPDKAMEWQERLNALKAVTKLKGGE
jgi:tetratricopeptide (TPR) repeat protein